MKACAAFALGILAGGQLLLAQKVPIPEFYGIYLVVDGKLVQAKDAVSEKRMKTIGSLMSSSQGIATLSRIHAAHESYVLLYGKSAEGLLQAHLGRLTFVERMQLGMGIITDPKTMRDARMWVLAEDIPLNVGPVKGQEDLFRIVPQHPLTDGVYALYYGALQSSVPIEGAAAVFDFSVGKVEIRAESPSPVTPASAATAAQPPAEGLPSSPTKGSWRGWITDETCGAKGANPEHKDCAAKCAALGKKLVFYSSDDAQLYGLDKQDVARSQLGREVTVRGSLHGDTIAVDSIRPAAD